VDRTYESPSGSFPNLLVFASFSQRGQLAKKTMFFLKICRRGVDNEKISSAWSLPQIRVVLDGGLFRGPRLSILSQEG
jgi:hypothetical protein